MALPTARRPKEVEEELREELELKRREELILRVNPHHIFIEAMKAWYNDLSRKEKSRLTPRRLKRKAVAYCYPRKLIYDNLPPDWVLRLQSECGLKFKVETKKELVSPKEEPEEILNGVHSDSEDDPIVPRSPLSSASSSTGSSMFTVVDFSVKEDAKEPTETAPPISKDCVDGPAKKKLKLDMKNFRDLTAEPPPPEWLQSYAKGTMFPRVLRTYSTEETNYMFWDYSPASQDLIGQQAEPIPRTDIELRDIKGPPAEPTYYKHSAELNDYWRKKATLYCGERSKML